MKYIKEYVIIILIIMLFFSVLQPWKVQIDATQKEDRTPLYSMGDYVHFTAFQKNGHIEGISYDQYIDEYRYTIKQDDGWYSYPKEYELILVNKSNIITNDA